MPKRGDPSARAPTLDEFLEGCRAACDFLVREFGFVRLDSPLEPHPKDLSPHQRRMLETARKRLRAGGV